MSVLGIDQKLRRSFNKLKSYGGTDKEPDQNENTDSSIFLQTFLHHWDSCHQTFINFESDSTQVQDDVINVSAQLEQMIELLKHESGTCSTNSILDYILSENVLGELSAWTKSLPSSLVGSLINLQIDLYEILIMDKERGISLLSHQTILRPLISILELCEALGIDEIEAKLLNLIYDLSTLLIESPELIELFLSSSSTSKRLILFSLLTPNLHKTGLSGQRAREAVLIYISMSCKHKIVENLIAQSNFCLILATGLSALFSALPSSLDVDHPSWHKLDMSDCQMIPELDSMMTSFELCSAVVEVNRIRRWVFISLQLMDAP
ncbi:UPF0518 protein GK23746 [Eurytemora carolleeae]|uniref:UPF0518 protein GK23746 n=1 Tax=Eurytemora carolleeae TaxID=1294199 RepID=UPI000C76BDE7|nr:UPF0518 protein GK23746 [Eurytemora carolleeae]|eukprot:XP_023347145.1 UPF0518 protein GK23746-like [Eurytemora affinis]